MWDLKILLGVSFQIGWILWGFISQFEIWHVWQCHGGKLYPDCFRVLHGSSITLLIDREGQITFFYLGVHDGQAPVQVSYAVQWQLLLWFMIMMYILYCNFQVYQVEEEMREMLKENQAAKKAMEDKVKRLTRAMSELESDLYWNLGDVNGVREVGPGSEVIKLFSCSPQLSMKFFLLKNIKMPTIVGTLTFMIKKNRIIGLSEPGKGWISWNI